MTRADIEKAYNVNASSGVIQSLGKFEGESIVVPHFYDQWQSGVADEDFGSIAFFTVEDEDRVEFGNELFGVYGLMLAETEQGFVNSGYFSTEQEYYDAIERVEAEQSEMESEG